MRPAGTLLRNLISLRRRHDSKRRRHDSKREVEFAQSRRYEDGDAVITKRSSEPEYTVACFIARGGFGDVYRVVRVLKQKEQEGGQSFAMKVIRVEGKDREARVKALRSLVEETHFALRVRRAAGDGARRARDDASCV